MSVKKIDAALVRKCFLAGAAALQAKKEYINELNVFPVPDGDTGTNMTMTIMSAADEVAALEEPSMETICKAISSGSLRGARGNSGVILSKGAKGPVDLCSARTEVERRMADSRKVKVDFSLEDMDLSEFKGKATYEQIKAYVLEKTGLKVSSLYIAQIKKKCGLDVGENFNPAKSENARQPQCTPEKEDAIMQAFRHFGII